MKKIKKSKYEKAGVNIDKGNKAVTQIKQFVANTHSKSVLKNIGSFGGLFEISDLFKKYKKPVLVQSIDGVGTKLTVAKMLKKYDTIGEDIVNHCVNDILSMGARPLTFLDYIASEVLEPTVIRDIVKGMSKACRENGVSLVGGETAEMPGTYTRGEHDIAGVITGIVEKDKIITGDKIKEGDIILGFASKGLQTNGYSLARYVLFKIKKHTVKSRLPTGEIIGEELLRPHESFLNQILTLFEKKITIKGIAHITGGGFIENIPRILPSNLNAEIQKGSWPVLPIFEYIKSSGKISEEEMYRAFNMGIGMIIVVDKNDKDRIEEILNTKEVFWIGKIIKGNRKTLLK